MRINKFISKNQLGLVINDKRFSDLTTIKVGGKIKLLYYPSSVENLIKVIEYLQKRGKNYFILGNGSNIVASDKTYRNLVINGKHLVKQISFFDDYFVVSAFMDLRIVIAKLIERGISTLVNLAGIPATVGGAIVMNAGAFKMNISDNLLWVKYLEDGKEVTKDINDLYFSYRSSELKEENIIVLEAAFKIITDKEVMFIYKNILEKRRNRHPLNYPNCGSVFKNLEKKRAYEVIKDINMADYSIGGAKFSEKHANFIVNYNKAKASDIYKLIILAKKRALILENVTLKEEVILLNFPSYKLMFKILKK
jgi:UDP-N-acetylmuramate dehydrogenase